MKNNWKETFDKQFKELSVISGIGDGTLHGYDAKPYVVEFIESLLEEQKKELMDKSLEEIGSWDYDMIANSTPYQLFEKYIESLNHHD